MPRYWLGNISDNSTHITGPSEMANEATKPMIANKHQRGADVQTRR